MIDDTPAARHRTDRRMTAVRPVALTCRRGGLSTRYPIARHSQLMRWTPDVGDESDRGSTWITLIEVLRDFVPDGRASRIARTRGITFRGPADQGWRELAREARRRSNG